MFSDTTSSKEPFFLEKIPTPSENLSLLGHSCVEDFFLQMIEKKKIPHAFIFLGPSGIGKATFAFHLIRHLLNEKKEPEKRFGVVDKESSLFRQVASGVHPSLLYLTSLPQHTLLTVQEIRQIDHFLSTRSTSTFRIILIDYADDMHNAAANALLKNLEEPPKGTIFILLSCALNRLSLPLRSRCQVIRFHSLLVDDFERVYSEVFGLSWNSEQEREALFVYAKGSPRRALLFMKGKGLALMDFLENIASMQAKKKIHAFVESLFAQEEDKMMLEIFHDTILHILYKSAIQASMLGVLEKAKEYACAWQETQQQIIETRMYNLDKRQHALSLLNRLSFLRG